MKCSLGTSNFLEEIASFSHSIVFLYFFALITDRILRKVLGPTTNFPTWDLVKGLRSPWEFYFGGQWDLITKLTQDWGNRQTLGGHKQNLVQTRTQKKGTVTPQETDPDLPVSVLKSLAEAWVSSGLLQGQGH